MAEGSSNAEATPKKGIRRFIKPAARVVMNSAAAVGAIVSGGKALDYHRHPHEVLDDAARVVRNADKDVLEVYNKIEDTLPGGTKVSASGYVNIEPIPESGIVESPAVGHVIDLFYPGVEGGDRQNLEFQMNLMRIYLMKNVLNEQSFINVESWDEIIKNAASESGIAPETIRAVILGESAGDPTQVNEESGAAGPVGMTKEVAIENNLDPADRTDPAKVLPIAAKILKRDGDYFGRPDFGILAWHNGQTGTKHLIEGWTAENMIVFTDLQQMMKDQNLSVYGMLQSPYTRENMSVRDMDSSDLVNLRYAAAESLAEDHAAGRPLPD